MDARDWLGRSHQANHRSRRKTRVEDAPSWNVTLQARHSCDHRFSDKARLRAETSSVIALFTMMADSLRCLPSVTEYKRTPVPRS